MSVQSAVGLYISYYFSSWRNHHSVADKAPLLDLELPYLGYLDAKYLAGRK